MGDRGGITWEKQHCPPSTASLGGEISHIQLKIGMQPLDGESWGTSSAEHPPCPLFDGNLRATLFFGGVKHRGGLCLGVPT